MVFNEKKTPVKNQQGCFNCGESGHKSFECSKERKVEEDSDEDMDINLDYLSDNSIDEDVDKDTDEDDKKIKKIKKKTKKGSKNMVDNNDEDNDEKEEAQKSKKEGKKQKKKNAKQATAESKSTESLQQKKQYTQMSKQSLLEEELQRRAEMDAKKLYIAKLPMDVKKTHLMALSSDIKFVDLIEKTDRTKTMFGFLYFESEAKAEENFKLLQNRELSGEKFTVEFCGAKKAGHTPLTNYWWKKLIVLGMPLETMIDDVAEYFPKAFRITLVPEAFYSVLAYIDFSTDEDATEAFRSNKEIEVCGQRRTVLHANFKSKDKKRGKAAEVEKKQMEEEEQPDEERPPKQERNHSGKFAPPAKKAKL